MVSSLQHEVSVARLKLLELERAVSPRDDSIDRSNFKQNAELECLLRNSDDIPDLPLSMKYKGNI